MQANKIATKFFDNYRAQNVDDMVSLFNKDGIVHYVPFGEPGNVSELGAGSWNALIDTFPDLTNEVKKVWQDEFGKVAFVDVYIGGKQTKDGFGITNQGNKYWLRHLFIIEINESSEIIKLTAFWDNADWFKQLGKNSLD